MDERNKDLFALAKYVFTKMICSHFPTESHVKLQKLLFFLRVEELRGNVKLAKEHNCFQKDENFEAWIYGPVSRPVYAYFIPLFIKEAEIEQYLYQKDDQEFIFFEKICGKILNKYLSMSINDLVNYSHKNCAYRKARKDVSPDQPCENKLKEDENFVKFDRC